MIGAAPREPLGFNRETPDDNRATLEAWCRDNGAGYGLAHVAGAAAAGLLLGLLVAAVRR